MFGESSLHGNVFAIGILPVFQRGGATGAAHVRVALSHSHEARAALVVALWRGRKEGGRREDRQKGRKKERRVRERDRQL